MDAAERVAIVTGANHGIGAATAEALAADGVAVLISFLAIEDEPDPGLPDAYRAGRRRSADEVVERIRRAGGRAAAVEADLTDPSAIPALFDAAEAELGPVSIVVHNATGWLADTFRAADRDWIGRPLRRITAAGFDQQFGVDARAGALLIAEFADRHRARGADRGRIVTLTSGGPDGFPGEVSYGAAKAALVNYTMSAATELLDLGITANVLYPPITDTGWVTDEVREPVATDGRFLSVAEPSEPAEVITWLCSDAARRVTGTIVHLR